uniref:Uncharacterized protein n=1 Tax=Helianthus annuus TaxID=4232 RepID=A0A251SQ08_HELAN
MSLPTRVCAKAIYQFVRDHSLYRPGCVRRQLSSSFATIFVSINSLIVRYNIKVCTSNHPTHSHPGNPCLGSCELTLVCSVC